MNNNAIVLTRSVSLMGMAACLAATSPARADQAPPVDAGKPASTSQLEEIVVTAQKRKENLQNVPISISAFNAKALQERSIGNVAQLSAISPNVTLDASTPFSGSSAVLSAYIRGIGSDDFAFNIDPGVGIYVDGVYLARSVGANQDLLDVERVEILKGPQGTLFGRNTIGGAVQIVTTDPGKVFKFSGDVSTGSYDLAQVRGTVDIPITDGLYSSITFGVKSENGYVHRIPYPSAFAANTPSYTAFPAAGYNSPQTEGGEDNRNVRIKLKYDRGGPLRATLTGDYTYSTGGAANTLLATTENVPLNFAPPPGSNIPGTAFDPTGTQGFNFAGLYNFCIGSTSAQIAARNAQALCGVTGTQYPSQNFGASTPVNKLPSYASVNVDGNPYNDRLPYNSSFITGNIDTSYATGNSFSTLKNWGLAGTVDYKFSDALALKSITAYRKLSWQSGEDADGSPLNILQLSFDENQWQFSQEFQVNGNAFTKRLNYVLGAYYFKEKGDLHDYVTFDEGLLQVDGPNHLQTENYAFFGQIDARPIDLISFTAGGRYTHENKEFQGGQQDLNGFNYKLFGCSDANGNITPNAQASFAPPGVTCQQALSYPVASNPIQVYPNSINHLTFNNFSPKLGVQLHPLTDILLYGSWSKGYKTGGWTTRYTNPQLTADSYLPEKASTFEVGVKSSLLDRRLQINASAFSTIYDNIQLNFESGTSPIIGNAGNALIRGVELEVIARPVTAFTISTSLGYIDAHYTTLNAAVAAVSGADAYQAGTSVGGPLPKTPKFKVNITPRYEVDLGNGKRVIFLADYTHTTSSANDTAFTYLLMRPATDMFNASVSFSQDDGHYSITAGGTNITNQRYLESGQNNTAGGVIYGTYNRPATWFVKLAVKF